ncbi:MAG TPA: hypothetical protein VFQ75_09280, partial [Candidatus Limnocylindrales bacterium]|nr:hypothetical protein [Candidatus Limnocylindrales bacterium]
MNKHRIGALFAALALTLTFAGTVLATDAAWEGNGYPSASCTADTTGNMLWIWTGDSPTSLTINGHEYTGWEQQGKGAYHLTIDIDPGTNYPPVEGATTFVTYSGSAGTLTLSGCNESTTTTTTTSQETTT